MKYGQRIIVSLFFLLIYAGVSAQGVWNQKANFGGTVRSSAAAFSIGTKGYIGTGQTGVPYNDDFWEWDQSSNAWTQKASLPASPRNNAVGFSIGSKGFIGLGAAPGYMTDLWEWDQGSNAWSQKANFIGTGRTGAVAFAIGGKAYVGTGYYSGFKKDFWEWDIGTNAWTQKADFGGTARHSAVAFSIGTKGYIGTGFDGTYKQDLWEWEQATNTWIQKADLPGQSRMLAKAFSIDTKGYIATGWKASAYYNDFWEWDQVSNMWRQKPNFAGAARREAVGFSIGMKGYIGTGYAGSSQEFNDFWEWDPVCMVALQGSATTVYCGQLVSLNAGYLPSSGNLIYSWSPATGLNNTTIPNPVALPLTNTIYKAVVKDLVTQCTDSSYYPISVYPHSCAVTGNLSTIVCGQSVSLTATYSPPSNDVTYAWVPSGGLSSTSISNPVAVPTSTTVYQLTAHDTVTQCVTISHYSITVQPASCTISFSDDTICRGRNVSLAATYSPVNPYLVYSWTPAQTLNSNTISNPVAKPMYSTTYALIATDTSSHCKANASVYIKVNIDSCSITGPVDSICPGSSTTLSAYFASSNPTYTWSPVQGLSNPTIPNPVAAPTITTTYTVLALDAVTQCEGFATFKISVGPFSDAYGSSEYVCPGQSVTLCSFGGGSYSWSTGQTSSCISLSPTASATYTVDTWDVKGCLARDTVRVNIDCSGNIACTNNEGFETGTFGGWTGLSGKNDTTGGPHISWTGGFNFLAYNALPNTSSQHTIMSVNSLDPNAINLYTNQPDPFMTTIAPSGGYYSVRLGNSQTGSGAEGLKKAFTPTVQNSIFTYQYACVFQDAMHSTPFEPGFMVNVYDGTNALIPSLCDTIYGPDPVVPYLKVSPLAANPFLLYRPWSYVDLNLSAYIGQTVQIEFINFDCPLSGHWGYTYLDVGCNNLTSISPEEFAGTLTVYPNPSSGVFTIQYDREIERVEVYNVYGIRFGSVPDIQRSGGTVDISALANGIYFLKITDLEGGSVVRKAIKK